MTARSLTTDTGTAPAEAVGPLMRGIAVLRHISDAGGPVTVSELVRSTGLARSTVDRITATLTRMDYLRLDGHTAALAPRLMALGNAYLAAVQLPALLGPLAERLAAELDESVSLAVPDRDGIRFVHQTLRRRAMSLAFRIGDPLPAERTAQGTVFAAHWNDAQWTHWRARRAADPDGRAFLPALPPRRPGPTGPGFEERAAHARAQGWALDDQLIEPGLIALALPVRAPGGDIVCAVSVVSHTSRHSAASLRDNLRPALRDTVTAMEQRLREAGTTQSRTPGAYAGEDRRGKPTPSGVTAQQPRAEGGRWAEDDSAGERRPAPRTGGGVTAGAERDGGLADWTGASKHELGTEFVESLARGLTVITAFGDGRAELTLTAIAEATGLARATARRALITLEHLGQVETRERMFRLTPRVLALGYPPLSRITLAEIASPHLAALVGRVHDSASMAVLDGDAIQYTARVATGRVMSVDIRVGTRLPAHAASMGRVLLADLPATERAGLLATTELRALTSRTVTRPRDLDAVLGQVAADGYALVDGELEEGLRSLAVPVRDRSGHVAAAVNVAMHSSRRTVEQCLAEVLPELRATADRIEADLRVAGRFTRIPPV
ncbi:IclR family transcriptional regulator domain-containing protein [Streptomyces uncialis]|uniref:IclR family transcriptional regulator domain-containing protein n=1 Tax=Streptomyces uncialis TaxID=1048205 RepID=UPI0033F92776